jgi:hypothetical protein
MSTELPAALVQVLHAARRVEAAAVGANQRGRAIAATGRLLLAAQHNGWSVASMAPVLGISKQAALKRVERVRAESPVLALDLPVRQSPVEPPDPLAELELPIAERAWVSTSEALSYANITSHTLASWRENKLLPNTRWPKFKVALYAKSDLDRVLAAPAYKGRGHSFAAVRRLIQESA